MDEILSYYDVLGVPETASPEELKRAFRRAAKKHHPDVNRAVTGAAEQFKQCRAAYDCLIDPANRAKYDTILAQARRAAASSNVPPRRPQNPSSHASASPAPAAGSPAWLHSFRVAAVGACLLVWVMVVFGLSLASFVGPLWSDSTTGEGTPTRRRSVKASPTPHRSTGVPRSSARTQSSSPTIATPTRSTSPFSVPPDVSPASTRFIDPALARATATGRARATRGIHEQTASAREPIHQVVDRSPIQLAPSLETNTPRAVLERATSDQPSAPMPTSGSEYRLPLLPKPPAYQ